MSEGTDTVSIADEILTAARKKFGDITGRKVAGVIMEIGMWHFDVAVPVDNGGSARMYFDLLSCPKEDRERLEIGKLILVSFSEDRSEYKIQFD